MKSRAFALKFLSFSLILLNSGFAFAAEAAPKSTADQVGKWCQESRTIMGKFKWKMDPCNGPKGPIEWKVGGYSVQGRPLVYAEFGDPASMNTTLVLSAVHGDEITPHYIGIQAAHWLQAHREQLKNSRVIIAPMVNPDGFLGAKRTRTNAHGVDVNRNFATADWKNSALKAWKVKHRSDPRRYPGSTPSSEPETLFQIELIQRLRPRKILSIHSPLNHLDYDGPSAMTLSSFPNDYVKECIKLRTKLKAVSTGFFPGSLGNYAGRELGIPTLTLELPSADPSKAERYWLTFSKGIQAMIDFEMPEYASRKI